MATTEPVGPTYGRWSIYKPNTQVQESSRVEKTVQVAEQTTSTKQIQWLLIGLIAMLVVSIIAFYLSFGSLGPLARAVSTRAKTAASQFKVYFDAGVNAAGDGVLEIIDFAKGFLRAVKPVLDAISQQLGSIISVLGRSAIEVAHQFSIMVQMSIDSILRPIDAFFKYQVPAMLEIAKLGFETIKDIAVKIYNAFNPNNCGSLTQTFTTL